MAKFNDNEFYDLHFSPNQGRSGKNVRGKMYKKYDGKNLNVRDHMGIQGGFKIKVTRNGIEGCGLD